MKKGFTLVELLGVVMVIALIALLTFPAIGSVLNSSKKSLHADQVRNIEEAAVKWSLDNENLFDEYHLNIIYIDLKSLQNAGYIAVGNLIDPLTNKEMNGCVQVIYNEEQKKYNFIYDESTCDAYASKEAGLISLGYVIYQYNTETETYDKKDSSVEYSSAGLQIYNDYIEKNLLKADGETADGLYETDDAYVFRGADPNNYVTLYGNETTTGWRILSISKKDFSMKLVRFYSDSQWNATTSEFKESTLADHLLSYIYKNDKLIFDKIITSDFLTGNVDNNSFSIKALKSSLNNSTTSLKAGTISIVDYANASATSTCPLNYRSHDCSTNNYLKTMFNSQAAWTLNTNNNQVWYIDTDGSLELSNPDLAKKSYVVVTISSNAYIQDFTNSVGSSASPYKIY